MGKKKQINRYTIAQVTKIEVRRIEGPNFIYKLLENIKKYNANPTNPYFLGDVEILREEGIVKFKRYKKITAPSTLETIDQKTINFNSDYDLKQIYGTDLKNNHPFVIVYRANKKIRTLPLVYKKKKQYIDREYVKFRFIESGRNIEFLTMLLTNSLIECSSRASLDAFDDLYALRESLKYNLPATVNLTPMHKFYSAFIQEGGHFNYYNFRLLAMLLKEYEETKENTLEEDDTLEQQVLGQLVIEEYAMLELRERYEEIKLSIGEGTLDEVYGKKLLPQHKTTK